MVDARHGHDERHWQHPARAVRTCDARTKSTQIVSASKPKEPDLEFPRFARATSRTPPVACQEVGGKIGFTKALIG